MSRSTALGREAHWEGVYRKTPNTHLSWFQPHPVVSLELITAAFPSRDARIIDIGGGDSLLVDHLLGLGYGRLTVLDISTTAVGRAQMRLGVDADKVRWIVGDVLTTDSLGLYDVWHDRALFHFLVDRTQRHQYLAAVTRSLAALGAVVIATFAPDGPEQCSGLDVRRYDAQGLAAELGEGFQLVDARCETHDTPAGAEQRFVYALLRRVAGQAV